MDPGSPVAPAGTRRGPLLAVMLAGAVDPSLRRDLTVPPLCLPMGLHGTLLDMWLDVIAPLPGCAHVTVVVSSASHVRPLRAVAGAWAAAHPGGPRVSVMEDPASWRGTAGLIRDLSWRIPSASIAAVEAHCVPPRSLRPLLEAFDAATDGVVGSSPFAEPAGVCLLDRSALSRVPPVGYLDLKEQLLPALHGAGRRIRLVQVTDRVLRIRDRAGYLRAFRGSLGGGRCRVCRTARVSPRAHLAGACAVEDGAVIEGGALVQDSVVLEGAVVGAGAVMTRSVALPHASLPEGARAVERIVGSSNGATWWAPNGAREVHDARR